MSFFAPLRVGGDGDRPASRARRVGFGLLCAGALGALLLAVVPAPYAIERPGPVFDTLGDVQIERDSEQVEVPLISIPNEPTYPTEGSLSMLTVNLVGNREAQPDWFEVVTAWGDPSKAVVPLDAVFPVGETAEESNEQGAIEMQNSQRDAIAAALTELGHPIDRTITVDAFSIDSPSDGLLEEGDRIVAVDGTRPADVNELRSIIAENGVAEPVSIEVQRDGREVTVDVVPRRIDGPDSPPIVGITAGIDYDFPFDVKIQLDKVGGPSAGMMFALGIMDKLTPGALNGGNDVAGTGTITGTGIVGPIGGIRQKMYGARDAGAEYFLAPESNCDEVTGHIPEGLTVFAVGSLDDSLSALAALRDGSDLTAIGSCSPA